MNRLLTVLDLIKWQHTVFALPMALAAVVLAHDAMLPMPGGWWLAKVVLIVLACFAARAAAMAYNRWADRDVDVTNPRTAMRPSVTGALSPQFLLLFVVICCLAFIAIARFINPLAFALSPVFLAVLLGYSHAKRFTVLAHLWLGIALGLAPIGAWIAITGSVSAVPVLLGLAIVPWVAGFDILYALADIEHDRREGLHSIPARLGPRRAMLASRCLHVIAFMLLIGVGLAANLSTVYLLSIIVAGSLLIMEHRLVSPTDLSRLPTAFQTLNGLFSFVILLGITLDTLLR